MANQNLYGKSYRIPQNIVQRLQTKLLSSDKSGGEGMKRAKFIVNNGTCTYQMLKRLKNFFDHYDPATQIDQYEWAGGKNMQDFVERILNSERNLVKTRKNVNVMFMPQLDSRSLTPNSGNVKLGVNEEKENKEVMNGGVAVIFNSEDKVLLLKRNETDSWEPGKYGLVGGKIEDGETPEEGTKREVFEESGLMIDNFVGDFVIRFNKNMVYVFTTIIDGNPEILLSDEHSEYGWFNTDEIKNLPTTPHLDDFIALSKQKLIIWDAQKDEMLD